jgi:hypothetical protein
MARFVISGLWKDKAVKDATKSIKGLEKTTDFFSRSSRKYWLAATAAAGFYAKKLAKDSVQAALSDAKSQRVLAQTLGNVVNANEAATISAEASIQKLSKQYGIVDDDLRPALSSLVLNLKDVTKATNALDLAVQISTATGAELSQVTSALSRAYTGNLTSLGKLRLGLTKAELKSGDLDKIMSKLRKTFGGFAKAEMNTVEGKFKLITVAAGEAEEVIGTALVEAFIRAIDAGNGIEDIGKKIEQLSYKTADLITGLTTPVGVKNKNSLLGEMFSGFTQLRKPVDYIVNRIIAIGTEQRKSAAIAVAASKMRISIANVEALAKKKANDLTDPKPDTRTELQRIADAAAAKAGFKVAEDLDSLNKIAAANRLAENRTYQFEYINSLQDQVAEFAKSEAAKVALARKGIAEIEAMLTALGTKASNGFDINFYMKVFGAGQGGNQTPTGGDGGRGASAPISSIQDVINAEMAIDRPFMPGDPGYTGTAGQTVNNYNVSVTAQGSILAEQELENLLLQGIQRVQFLGANPILTNGGR